MAEGKLKIWQERLELSKKAYENESSKMAEREKLYMGDKNIDKLVDGDPVEETSHVRNIIFENIESMVSSSIPMPKVTPRRKEDEELANLIEHFLRNEVDRLPFETINDMAERTVPIQGGVGYLVEWDNTKRSHDTVGEVDIRLVDPACFAPQPGVFSGLSDMDWFIVKIPTTKEAVRRKYDVDVSDESESEPDVRSRTSGSDAEDAVTEYMGYEKSDSGGINRYCWVNDTELEDLENYQARRQPKCLNCGRVKPLDGELILTEGAEEPSEYKGGVCPYCGSSEWTSEEQQFEEIPLPINLRSGYTIPAGAKIPFYMPDCYPIILQKNVSVHGQLLGSSDVDIIKTQQNTTNRLSQKIIDRLLKAGTKITLPESTEFKIDPKDNEKWYLNSPADKNLIGVYDFNGEIGPSLSYLHEVYEEARQMLGITDSFQGRKDTTATSGRAKEFSASQAAGRLESKRVLKYSAYADIYELIFKYTLAYADEPRPVSYKNSSGETVYDEFNRYDFLKTDADGQYYWDDQFLFSCDTTAPLASNRAAMWQETNSFLQSGAFGDPHKTETLILFWAKMEELHYPGAGRTKKYLEEQLAKQQLAIEQQVAMEQQAVM